MIKNLNITQLVENTANGPGVLGEHGNSFYIQADEYCLLFDTGQDSIFDSAICLEITSGGI